MAPGEHRDGYFGSEWLAGGRPRDVLHRLLDGDPLGFAERVRARQSAAAYFLNEERLKLRAVARAAYDSMRYRGDPPLAQWIDACVEKAMRELLEEQVSEEFHLLAVTESPELEFYTAVGRAIGTEPELARLACHRLNGLTADARRVFRALVIERASVEECSMRGWGDRRKILELFESAVLDVSRAFDARSAQGPDWSQWS